MKYVFLSLSIAALSCSTNKINDNDLAGKAFKAKITLDASEISLDAEDVQQRPETVFRFKNDHTGVCEAEIGGMNIEEQFKWKLKSDSIRIEMLDTEHSTFYAPIRPTESGFAISRRKGVVLKLTEVQ